MRDFGLQQAEMKRKRELKDRQRALDELKRTKSSDASTLHQRHRHTGAANADDAFLVEDEESSIREAYLAPENSVTSLKSQEVLELKDTLKILFCSRTHSQLILRLSKDCRCDQLSRLQVHDGKKLVTDWP